MLIQPPPGLDEPLPSSGSDTYTSYFIDRNRHLSTMSVVRVSEVRPTEAISENPVMSLVSGGIAGFVVEACQATLAVTSLDGNFNNGHILQEGFCNSWGQAFAMKQHGIDYQNYQGFTQNSYLVTPGIPMVRTLTLSQAEYDMLPSEPVLT